MTPNPHIEKTPIEFPPSTSIAPQSPAPLPAWWRADQQRFDGLIERRLRIHHHEMAAAKKAQSIMAVSLIAAVSVYSVDATGAVSIPAAPGFLVLFLALAFPIMVAWLLERRLIQQLSDINLRSELWLDLVEAVKHGCIDVPQLEFISSHESEVELFLRKEAALAARFLASRRLLVPHLPIFGHCFTLENS